MRRATPATIGLAIGSLGVPSIIVQQVATHKLWLMEQNEPFYEIELVDDGVKLVCRTSIHCSPAWAAIVTAKLCDTCTTVDCAKDSFVQDTRGNVRYGHDAEAYWRVYQDHLPLLTERFAATQRH